MRREFWLWIGVAFVILLAVLAWLLFAVSPDWGGP